MNKDQGKISSGDVKLYNVYYEESVSWYGIIEYVRTSVVVMERLRYALNETRSICECHVTVYRTFVVL